MSERAVAGQRSRILEAMVQVVCEQGFAGATVTTVCARAKVSRRTFYELFDSREQCFLAVMDQGYAQAIDLIWGAFDQAERWQDGVRAALSRLLLFFDSQPTLARAWLVETLGAGSWALEHRERHIIELTRAIVEHWRAPSGAGSHPLAAVGVMTSVLGVIQTHLVTERPEPLITLLGPLMGVATAPYLSAVAVAEEIKRAEQATRELLASASPAQQDNAFDVVQIPRSLRNPKARRASQCLHYLVEHPGASNRQVATAIGVASHTQISALLARLAAMGLLVKRSGRPGFPNAWSLTPYGLRIARTLGYDPASALASTLGVRTSHTVKTADEVTVTS